MCSLRWCHHLQGAGFIQCLLQRRYGHALMSRYLPFARWQRRWMTSPRTCILHFFLHPLYMITLQLNSFVLHCDLYAAIIGVSMDTLVRRRLGRTQGVRTQYCQRPLH